jgi:hypothetical protein
MIETCLLGIAAQDDIAELQRIILRIETVKANCPAMITESWVAPGSGI